ncbi:hypothetical protein LWP59_35845 [Amycolatopsis acidiphila]|uniref:DUF1795 domain-containing protein n=1 Tax=Amycolatopsis acidiphila TaxID=715473 RepID=A0A558A2S8_9PSEU|nr:hypothetical protein [Amycolatopsis acidiphila]TVT18560.1 hypothetical protein FNH06_27435 [Amycolatopsis acidiphila]UIJ59359.1 hypothetical protein LWP59_35845 [Amycolatopsis acidiphila]
MQWQRVEKPDFGYAVAVPQGWDERPPNLKNSPWETARFGESGDRRHSLIVFRHPVKPGRDVMEVAELVQPSLERSGFTDFEITPGTMAGRPAAVLWCAKHDAGRTWAVREYLSVQDDVAFCLGCGTSVPGEDDELFASIAERFELL